MDASYFFAAHTLDPLIIDCGSNIGMSVIFFKKLYPNARVICFEPDPATFTCLSRNISQNDLDDIELHQCALSKYDGQIDFYRSRSQQTSSLLMSTIAGRCDDTKKIKVDCRKLSQFIDREVDLLKMDIEGAEEDVLQEFGTSGKFPFVKRMHVECHHHIDPRKNGLSRIFKNLRR